MEFDSKIAERVFHSKVERKPNIIGQISGFMLRNTDDSPMIIKMRRWDREYGIAREIEIHLNDDLAISEVKTYFS